MKLLFENWRKYVLTESTSRPGLALYAEMREEYGMTRPHLFLYDPQKLMELFDGKQHMPQPEEFYNTEVSIAMIIAGLSEDLGHGPCWGSFEIIRSAVHKNQQGSGTGKLIYELMMAYVQEQTSAPTTSDRSETSPSAQRVWKGLQQRAVSTDPFDDIEDPQTPPPEDDCKFPSKSGGNKTGADRGYRLSDEALSQRQSQMIPMIKRHEQVVEFINSKTGYDEPVIIKKLQEVMYHLFSVVH